MEKQESVMEFELLDGKKASITICSGKQGRRLVLRLINLLRPEPNQTVNPKAIAGALMSGSDDVFVNKADKLISDILSLAFIEINGHMVKLDDDIFDSQFAARYDVMLDLLVEVMTFNGFFDLIKYFINLLKTGMFQDLVPQKT